MGEMSPAIAMLMGVITRLGIPIILTLVGIVVLRWLDERWQSQVEKEMVQVPLIGNQGCWKTHDCPPEKLAGCKAYQHQEWPCWQVFRRSDGQLQEKCLGCQSFTNAPVPVAS